MVSWAIAGECPPANCAGRLLGLDRPNREVWRNFECWPFTDLSRFDTLPFQIGFYFGAISDDPFLDFIFCHAAIPDPA